MENNNRECKLMTELCFTEWHLYATGVFALVVGLFGGFFSARYNPYDKKNNAKYQTKKGDHDE